MDKHIPRTPTPTEWTIDAPGHARCPPRVVSPVRTPRRPRVNGADATLRKRVHVTRGRGSRNGDFAPNHARTRWI